MRIAPVWMVAWALVAACSNTPAPNDAAASGADGSGADVGHFAAGALTGRTEYDTLSQLYGGLHGIYRGCGPNNAVCHNGRQYPSLSTEAGVLATINAPCNQMRERPQEIHDYCEREGDRLRIGTTLLHLGYFAPTDTTDPTMANVFRLTLRPGETLPTLDGQTVQIVRPSADPGVGTIVLGELSGMVAAGADGASVAITLPSDANGEYLRAALSAAGVPGDPTTIQLGDPNRNGRFGVDIGARMVLPGDPMRSYLMQRLVSPDYGGPLMPLANCCYWTRQTARALWCWIAGLRPDGSNARDPIDYAHCPDGPADSVIYPQTGPACETTQLRLCPVQPVNGRMATEPTWVNAYAIIRDSCGGGCHLGFDRLPMAGLDLSDQNVAYANLARLIRPGDPMASVLYQRISAGPRQMPLARPALPDAQIQLIRTWIAMGAMR